LALDLHAKSAVAIVIIILKKFEKNRCLIKTVVEIEIEEKVVLICLVKKILFKLRL
jgi:hypothetical protein